MGGLLFRIRMIPVWISNQTVRFYRFIGSVVGRERLETRAALYTLVLMFLAIAVLLVVRTFRLSLEIRKVKNRNIYRSPDKKEIWALRKKSCLGTLWIVLGILLAGFLLIRFIFPLFLSGGSSVSQLNNEGVPLIENRIRLFVSRYGVVDFLILWLWAFSRRVRSSGTRKLYTFIFLACLIGFNWTTANAITSRPREATTLDRSPDADLSSEKETSSEIETDPDADLTSDEMILEAYRLYNEKEYARSEALYTDALERGGYTKMTDADILNNLALAQLQQKKNGMALDTMRKVFDTENANTYHVINLLVAAHVNGIPSRAILNEKNTRSLVESIPVDSEEPGDYLKLRNTIAYNLSYMDMELEEGQTAFGTGFGALFPDSGIPQSMSAGWQSREECLESLDKALDIMLSENTDAYGEEDADITELMAYLDALRDGGISEADSGDAENT